MELVITVAHPRVWPLRERKLLDLMFLFFGNDPDELKSQLAPIGAAMAQPGGVVLQSRAPAGLLHLFANDWWQTASNNSGGLKLKIERLSDGVPTLLLDECGSWTGIPDPAGA